MDIIITDSALRKFLGTPAKSEEISRNLSLCGPTFDRVTKVGDDYVYEIEVITNRIDTASAQGIAREAATILSQFNIPAKFVSDPYKDKLDYPTGLAKQFHFNIGKGLVIRFSAIALENITVKASSKNTQQLLENCGQRALNNCIDITNELTLLYGMPSHVFDLDKLSAQSLTIRESKSGETITTLDEKKNTLIGGDIVIEDGSGRLVDLCGVMGGQMAEVDEHTKNILLIVPVYNPRKIRRTSLSLQKRTVAAQIYEKGPDPELTLPVISKAIQLFKERAGAEVSSSLFDFYPVSPGPKFITLDFDWLNRFVGVDIEKETVVSILAGLGFGGTIEKNDLICSVPSWRYDDITIKEDLAEEVSRIYGYYRLPPSQPCVNLPPEPKNILLETELKIKHYLSAIGFHEIYNSSLTSEDLLFKTGLKKEDHIKLKNALSSDFEFLRTRLTPSLLQNLKNNQGKTDSVAEIYEIANCYLPITGKLLPLETSTLSLIGDENYVHLKGKIESLLRYLLIKNVSFKPGKQTPPYFGGVNTAEILSGGQTIGHIGLIKPIILRRLGLQTTPTAVEIDLGQLVSKIDTQKSFRPVSEYPYIIEDITLNSKKLLGDIIETIFGTSKLVIDVSYLESFKDKHTFRISFGSMEKNLEQSEINSLKDIICERFKV